MQGTVAEAIATALVNLNIKVVTHVPGHGGNEAFKAYKIISRRNPEISFNEEVAYTISHGAALVGKRSAILIKTHGLLKAANSVSDSLYANLTAGFVTILFDDKTGKSSDNILEIEPFLKALGIPFKFSTKEKIYSNLIEAFFESEKNKMPYVIVVDAADILQPTYFKQEDNFTYNYKFSRNIFNQLIHPMFADYQYKVFKSKMLDTNFAQVNLPPLPKVPESVPLHLVKEIEKYIPFFDIFKKYRSPIVTGDTTLSSFFAFPPYNCIDMVTYIGSSIPLAIGAYLATGEKIWAISGDFGFIAAGNMALIEVNQRNIPLNIVIFNNRKAAATGGQPINKKIISQLLSTYEKHLTHINIEDTSELSTAIQRIRQSEQLEILVVDIL